MVKPYLSRLRPAEPGRLHLRQRSRFEPAPRFPIDGPAIGPGLPPTSDAPAADVEIELDRDAPFPHLADTDAPFPHLAGTAATQAAPGEQELAPARTAAPGPAARHTAPAPSQAARPARRPAPRRSPPPATPNSTTTRRPPIPPRPPRPPPARHPPTPIPLARRPAGPSRASRNPRPPGPQRPDRPPGTPHPHPARPPAPARRPAPRRSPAPATPTSTTTRRTVVSLVPRKVLAANTLRSHRAPRSALRCGALPSALRPGHGTRRRSMPPGSVTAPTADRAPSRNRPPGSTTAPTAGQAPSRYRGQWAGPRSHRTASRTRRAVRLTPRPIACGRWRGGCTTWTPRRRRSHRAARGPPVSARR